MINTRHQKILELVRGSDIFTQEELTLALKNDGVNATQATVSRDIRKLGLTKIQTAKGQKYAAPNDAQMSDPMTRVFRDGLISVEAAGNMLVLRTIAAWRRQSRLRWIPKSIQRFWAVWQEMML